MIKAKILTAACTLALSTLVSANNCKAPKAGIENAFPKLPALNAPIDMVQAKSDSSFWLLALREGEVVSFDNNAKASRINSVLNISSKVLPHVEMGLTGIAIHPDYPKDKRLFVVYSDKNKKGRTTVSSFILDPKTRKADLGSEKVLFTLDQPAMNHNGGDIAFDHQGYLYTAFGDGGADWTASQNRKNFYGSVVRIDVSTEPYSIPKDNPFNKGQAPCRTGKGSQTCPEIFAYGLRNPWRFSFDRKTHKLWAGDVAEDGFEEIDHIQAGKNYGWPTMEGSICLNNGPCNKSGIELPITEYDNEGMQSVVAGAVYRGSKSAELQGHMIFSDVYSRLVYSVPADAKAVAKPNLLFDSERRVVSFAEGNDGEIYLLNFEPDYGDVIHRLVSKGCKS